MVAVIGAADLSQCKDRVVRLVNRTQNDYARQVKLETWFYNMPEGSNSKDSVNQFSFKLNFSIAS